jgi:hypothetical protein
MNAQELLDMPQERLDALFSEHGAGPIPDGEAKGTAIIAPGTRFSEPIAEIVNVFAWQGKVFDAKAGVLRNHITSLGIKAIIARILREPSWLDGVAVAANSSQTREFPASREFCREFTFFRPRRRFFARDYLDVSAA